MKKLIGLLILSSIALSACNQKDEGIHEVTSIPEGASSDNNPTRPVVNSASPTVDPNVDANATVLPTPSIQYANLGEGVARDMAQATDSAYEPTPRNELSFGDGPINITFSEFYDGFNMRTGLILSDKLVSLDGKTIIMEGYVAPPLKPKLDFFVLTSIPMATCPFCSSASDWPDDIALVYLSESDIVYTPYPVRIHGRMEIGAQVDAETGMVSIVRIYAEDVEVLD